jgi:hypothetical protein
MKRIVCVLLFGAFIVPSGLAAQKQAASPQASQKSPTPKAETAVKKFGFIIQTVEPEQETGGYRYRLEGVTIDGWRLVLSCPKFPPVEVEREAFRKHSGDELAQKNEEYSDIERFRELALRSAVASIDELRTPSKYGAMTLYQARLLQPDVSEQERKAVIKDPYQIVVAHCWLINEVENGEDIFPIAVLSSDFRNWEDGKGYEVDAQTSDESLTLGCTETKGATCQSLPPSSYRATRNGSVVRLYDKDLNLMDSFRILSERSTKETRP